MNVKLDTAEVRLQAGWEPRPDGSFGPDATWNRIEWLVSNLLVRVGATDDGWTILYEDPRDGRLWELTYPDSASHGGGAPVLQVIDSTVASKKYGPKSLLSR